MPDHIPDHMTDNVPDQLDIFATSANIGACQFTKAMLKHCCPDLECYLVKPAGCMPNWAKIHTIYADAQTTVEPLVPTFGQR